MTKLSVAFCTDGIYPFALGGMQKHSRALIEELTAFPDLDVTVIHPHPQKIFADSVKEITIEGIDETKNYLLECYAYSKRVYKILIELNPDIIYSQGLSVWFGIKSISKKLIVNPHGLEPYQASYFKDKVYGFLFRLVFNYLFKHASLVVSLGGRLTEILKGKGKSIVEIPNAASIPSNKIERTDSGNIIRVLFLGRFAHNKGIDILFAAFDELYKQNILHQFKFTLAGKGPLYEFYRNKNRYPNVQLTGFVEDEEVPELYNLHDLFVLPTLFEGMPTVVLEAMSYGLPVIVSEVGATAVLVDNCNGKLITPGSVYELVEAFKWFLSISSVERKRLSDCAAEKFERSFTWPVVAAQYHRLFASMYQHIRLQPEKEVSRGKSEY